MTGPDAANTTGTGSPAKYRKRWTFSGYRVPEPGTFENDLRLDHFDVATMTAGQLWAEDVRARAALAYLISSGQNPRIRCYPELEYMASGWLRDRIAVVSGELERRRRDDH
jgi:hypothetical protein